MRHNKKGFGIFFCRIYNIFYIRKTGIIGMYLNRNRKFRCHFIIKIKALIVRPFFRNIRMYLYSLYYIFIIAIKLFELVFFFTCDVFCYPQQATKSFAVFSDYFNHFFVCFNIFMIFAAFNI